MWGKLTVTLWKVFAIFDIKKYFFILIPIKFNVRIVSLI